MHPEAHSGFGRMLQASGVDLEQVATVLDLGGQHINGSVHDHFPEWVEVVTLDLENADIIADARHWEPTRLFPLVIATELFEHVEDWPLILGTAKAALLPGGVFITTCASTSRPQHGATGAPQPAPGEWYRNVDIPDLEGALAKHFHTYQVDYLYPPGDAYAWARH